MTSTEERQKAVGGIIDRLRESGETVAALDIKRMAGDASDSDLRDLEVHSSRIVDLERARAALSAELPSGALDDPPEEALAGTGQVERTLGDVYVESDEYKRTRESGLLVHRDAPVHMPRELATTEALVRSARRGRFTRDTITTGTGTGAQYGGNTLPVPGPFPERDMVPYTEQLRIEGLLSSAPMDEESLIYIREVDPEINQWGVSAVAETEVKPQQDIQFSRHTVTAETLAGWVGITRQMFNSSAFMRSYINAQLPYRVMLRTEEQLLYGNGTSPQLEGIFNNADRQTQSFSTDIPQTIAAAIAKVYVRGFAPDAIVMHPTKFWSMVSTRYSQQFDNGFSTGAPNGFPSLNVWGFPVVLSLRMGLNQAGVGNWRVAGTFLPREGMVTYTTDSHSDWFIRNQLVVLAERRCAIMWPRPDLIVDTALA